MFGVTLVRAPYAASAALFRTRQTVMPQPANPASVSAHVLGSGTLPSPRTPDAHTPL